MTTFCPRCATSNEADRANCVQCGSPLPRRAAPAAMVPAAAGKVAALSPEGLEMSVLVQKSKVKQPVLAAIMGFFLPFVGAFYNGKIGLGLLFIAGEFLADFLGLAAMAVPTLLWHLYGAFQSHRWATQANAAALEKLLSQQRRAS